MYIAFFIIRRRLCQLEEGKYYWRILSPDEARHVWYNGKGDLCQIYDDGTEGMIEDDIRLNECIRNGDYIGISL